MGRPVRGYRRAAALLGVTVEEARRLEYSGKLSPVKTPAGNEFDEDDLMKLREQLAAEDDEQQAIEETERLINSPGRARGIQALLMESFLKAPGEVIYADRLAKRSGFTMKQIANAANGIRNNNVNDAKQHMVIVVPGRAWRWDAPNTGGHQEVIQEEGEDTEKVWCPEPGVIFRYNLKEHKLYRINITEIG